MSRLPVFLMPLLLWAVSLPSIASLYTTNVLIDTPMAYYRMGDSSGTTILDSSGNGHHATLHGGVTLGQTGAISGDSDTAVTFNGSDGYISVDDPNPFRFNNASVSVEAWVQLTEDPGYHYFAWIGNGLDSTNGFMDLSKVRVGQREGGLQYKTGPHNSIADVANSNEGGLTHDTLPKQTWMHLVGVTDRDLGTHSLYVNGVLIDVGNSLAYDFTNATNFEVLFGAFNLNPGVYAGFHDNLLDEVAIYDYALSADRIEAHFQAANSPLPNSAIPAPNSLWLWLITLPLFRRLNH